MSLTPNNDICEPAKLDATDWKSIKWYKVNRHVDSLQKRIYRASENDDKKKVRDLQRQLMRSNSALLKAINRVTKENKGKFTPGIDGFKATSDKARGELFDMLKSEKMKNHRPKPAFRKYIPKKNGKLRSLGIPTIKIFCGLGISHETVRKAQIIIPKEEPEEGKEEENKLFYVNSEIKPSGFFSYDVEWEPIDGGFYYRHLLFDLVNWAPVAELLAPDEGSETTYKFLSDSLKPYEMNCIVTDLKPGYDRVMMKLGFKHQHCTFHLSLSVNERIRKYLKQKEIKLRIQFQKENKNISQYQLNKLVKKELNKIKDEIKIYKQLIFELFEQQTYDKALSYINLLKNEINNYPEVLKSFLIKDFFPEYKKFLWFLKDEFKGKLTRTNNASEMYFHATLPKSKKKRYRTKEGVFNQICTRRNDWMKKPKFQLRN